MLTLLVLACDIAPTRVLLTTADQDEVSGDFDSYERVQLEDVDRWLAREIDVVRWDVTFDQDHRIEVYDEPTPGRVVHVEAMWRQVDAGVVDTDVDAILGLILDAIIQYDQTTKQVCATGL